jgi:hypothetical protein
MNLLRKSLVLAATGGVAVLLGGCSLLHPAAPPVRPPPPPPPPAPTSVAPPPTSVAPAPSAESPLPPTRVLGTVDLNTYCRHLGFTGAKLLNNTVYGWVCSTDNQLSVTNVNYACRWKYGLRAVSHFTDYNNPNSWQCWSV